MNGIQWNGKGKKYYDHKIIFDGEYLNGKEWKGKSYIFSLFKQKRKLRANEIKI